MMLNASRKLNTEADGARLLSSPRQSETVWLLRVKLCNVVWADVIAHSCPVKENTPPHIPPLHAVPPALVLLV